MHQLGGDQFQRAQAEKAAIAGFRIQLAAQLYSGLLSIEYSLAVQRGHAEAFGDDAMIGEHDIQVEATRPAMLALQAADVFMQTAGMISPQ